MTTVPAIGDNSGVVAYFGDFIKRVEDGVKAANAWVSKIKKIEDAETATRMQDCLEQIKAELKAIEDDRLKQVRPHLDEQQMINGHAKTLCQPLVVARDFLDARLREWKLELRRRQDEEVRRKTEEARKAQEEAMRLQEASKTAGTVEAVVAAEKAAAVAVSSMENLNTALTAKPQVKGDFSTRASGLRTYWSAQITDLNAAVAHYLTIPACRADIQAVVQGLANADARRMKQVTIDVPGIKGVMEER